MKGRNLFRGSTQIRKSHVWRYTDPGPSRLACHARVVGGSLQAQTPHTDGAKTGTNVRRLPTGTQQRGLPGKPAQPVESHFNCPVHVDISPKSLKFLCLRRWEICFGSKEKSRTNFVSVEINKTTNASRIQNKTNNSNGSNNKQQRPQVRTEHSILHRIIQRSLKVICGLDRDSPFKTTALPGRQCQPHRPNPGRRARQGVRIRYCNWVCRAMCGDAHHSPPYRQAL